MNSVALKNLLIALNSSVNTPSWKYPIGNKELTKLVEKLEKSAKIKYNQFTGKWEKTK